MTSEDKAQVARVLRETAALLRVKGENPYRARAYDRAAERLEQAPESLEKLLSSGRLRELPGIGPALEAAIRELATTGKLRSHERLREEFPPEALELTSIPGITPKRASALYAALGVTTGPELEAACRDGRVETVKGFGPKLQAQLQETLQSRQTKPSPRLRISEALSLAKALTERLLRLAEVERVELAGEARRFKEEVDCLELLVVAPEAARVLRAFCEDSAVAKVEQRSASGAQVRMFEKDARVALHVAPAPSAGTAWVLSTGSSAHLAQLQAIARDRDAPFPQGAATEEALYAALALPWIPPELREGSGELEAVQTSALDQQLLRSTEVLGVVHSHSTWSDGKDTLEVMARAAQALGFRYLTVTDHSPAAFYAGGVAVEALKQQWDEIDALNERLSGFRLLKGCESDILQDGALDYPDDVLERLEVVIGSVHKRHKLDESAMTQRILKAMDHPRLQILGHLTGRLIQSRDPYALVLEEIFAKAAERKVAIEVNGSPYRLDIRADLVREALRAGVRLVVSADSHSVRELGNVSYAVSTARRGWARTQDVLNTQNAAKFTASLR